MLALSLPTCPAADAPRESPLFAAAHLPPRRPRRPLGALSDVVALSLPQALRAIRPGDGSVNDAAAAARWVGMLHAALAVTPAAADVPAADRALACLDLSLLQQACDHAGVAMPEAAVERLHALAADAGRLPSFLYEDCVLHNPLDHDPRLFCDAQAGASERDFLIAHQRVEARIARALACIAPLVASAEHAPGLRAARLRDALAQYAAPLEAALSGMEESFRALRAMPVEDFLAFRPYYTPSPRTGIPGPSGRFSAAIFLFRFAIEGVTLLRRRPDIAADLRQWLALYPQAYRAQLQAWLDAAADASVPALPADRQGLARLALQPWAQSTALPELLRRARATMDLCTAMHLGLARRYAAGYAVQADDAEGHRA